MSTYLIGDIHGCYNELNIILSQVQFNPKVDTLWLTGDLVARGPCSLEVLRLVRDLGDSVRIVLGNHDLHLLAVHAGVSRNKSKYCITPILESSDVDELINWLRYQPVLQLDEKKHLIMTHAGITPQWDIATACQCAKEVETMLKSDNYSLFLNTVYNNESNYWNKKMGWLARLQFSINVFTRMRYCFPDGKLEMKYKNIPEQAPILLKPWFTIPGRIPKKYDIVFGHWSLLMGQGMPSNIYGLDTGCCWGGKLTLMHWENKVFFYVPSKH